MGGKLNTLNSGEALPESRTHLEKVGCSRKVLFRVLTVWLHTSSSVLLHPILTQIQFLFFPLNQVSLYIVEGHFLKSVILLFFLYLVIPVMSRVSQEI